MSREKLIGCFTRFKEEPSVDARAHLAKEICGYFDHGGLTRREKEVVKEILDVLSRDIEMIIRKTLAEELKRSPDLPHDIAVRLALDVEEVANPILEFSEILNDDDLEEIIKTTKQLGKLSSIAKRNNVSERISNCIIDTGQEMAVVVLFNNESARISDDLLNKSLRAFSQSENILGAMIKRGGLSAKLAEKMIQITSEKVRDEALEEYGSCKINAINNSMRATEERVIVETLSDNLTHNTKIDLVAHLHRTGKLNPSLILRALCRGDLVFFEAGMAKLAGIPISNAKKLIYDGDSRGFSALFNAASMPATMRRAAEILLRFIVEMKREEGENFSSYSRKLIEKVTSFGYEKEVPNMQYLLTLVSSPEQQTTSQTHN